MIIKVNRKSKTARVVKENAPKEIHAEWIKEPVEFWPYPDYKCSHCGGYADDTNGISHTTHRCPNCFAIMDLK